MSLTTRNVWKDGHVEVGVNNYREASWKIAQQEHVDFVDVSAIAAAGGTGTLDHTAADRRGDPAQVGSTRRVFVSCLCVVASCLV
jgi:hypothetical protein